MTRFYRKSERDTESLMTFCEVESSRESQPEISKIHIFRFGLFRRVWIAYIVSKCPCSGWIVYVVANARHDTQSTMYMRLDHVKSNRFQHKSSIMQKDDSLFFNISECVRFFGKQRKQPNCAASWMRFILSKFLIFSRLFVSFFSIISITSRIVFVMAAIPFYSV